MIEHPSDDVIVGDYTPDASAEALALERLCPQGGSLRLTFRRSTFHRRADNFAERRILTARQDGRLVGVAAVAVKDMEVHGVPTRAAFLFDLRTHPEARRRGVGRRLASRALEWGLARAELAYTYAMAENRAIEAMCELFGAVDAGGYAYLVIPTCRGETPAGKVTASSFAEVHSAMRRTSGPFDLYANPASAMDCGAYVASWIVGSGGALAGCSAWDNREILAEVVEAVPFGLRLLDATGRALRLRGWPRVPLPGEEVRSWYLFDFFATEEGRASDLLRHVAAEARARGIDFLYLIHAPGDPMLRAVRAERSGPFSPVVPYRLLVRTPGRDVTPIRRLYVDVRDV